MHGHLDVKFVNAKQANETYQYKNTKKIYKTNATIWCIKTCRSADLFDINHCCVCSEKLLMMDRGTVRNM